MTTSRSHSNKTKCLIALTKAEERESLRRENRALKEAMRKEQTFHGILGKSEAINKVFSIIGKVADYQDDGLDSGARAARAKSSSRARSILGELAQEQAVRPAQLRRDPRDAARE